MSRHNKRLHDLNNSMKIGNKKQDDRREEIDERFPWEQTRPRTAEAEEDF